MRVIVSLIYLLLISALWPVKARAQEETLPPRKVLSIELAFDHIDVTSGFSGAHIEVFGHRRDKFTDVAVIVKGPEEDVIVWKKAQLFGAWINRYGIKFRKVPLYYAYTHSDGEVFENRNIPEEAGLGVDEMMLGKAVLKSDDTNASSYQAALIKTMRAKDLFPEGPEKIRFINDYFFRTRFALPTNAPTGTYKIHSFLIKDGKIVERDTDLLKVEQVGLNAFVYNSAHNSAPLYAFVSILLSLASGWFVGIIRVRP